MAHLFVILNNGVEEEYTNFEDIPKSFENVITFMPEIPPEPHTEEQHKEIELWQLKFNELMRRETK